MPRSKLRIYYGPEDTVSLQTAREEDEALCVPLSEILPVLADALHHERAWLRDFMEEEVTIPSDLYAIVRAYQHYHRPSA